MKQIISYIGQHLNKQSACKRVSFHQDLLPSGSPSDLNFEYLCLAQSHDAFNLFPPSAALILIVEMSPKKLHLRESASK